jgi:hypothetical protein
VDDAYGPGFVISTETGPDGDVASQFQADWGFAMGVRVINNTAWGRDMQRLVTALSVIANNGPTSIGGGGTPRQPLAPAIP